MSENNINAYLAVLNVPHFGRGTAKYDKKQIQKLMTQHEFDSDYTENINEDFCEGFETARNIITEIIKQHICE